ncbi:MAG: hypothetical protein WBD45_19400, partial [Terriglobales bacterium]
MSNTSTAPLPSAVDAVAREPAAHLIVDAAARHRAQCSQCHLGRGRRALGIGVRWIGAPSGPREQELDRRGLGKLRWASEPTVDRVEQCPQVRDGRR